MFGLEKKFETKLIESNFFDVTKLEIQLLKKLEETIEKSAEPEAVEEASGATWGSLPLTSDGVPQESSLTCGSSSSSTVCVSSRDIVPVEQRVDPQVTQTIPKVTPAPLKAPSAQKYVEIVNPSGFVNSNNKPISIGEHVGKQVILLNVMTYSCSNCQATFPYVNTWYEMYKDEGLIVIGLHTPEFAFEKDKQNVTDAMKKFGITYPVVMDNEYSTWNALDNRFWPRKYLIDIHGDVVFDHIGEGAYEETEKKIKELLLERRKVLRL
jgi:thiol-disulfide isomerase/thioredoxin